ncbi:MAG: type II toxin-antitoxin system ParD family antitoxin [Chloroflexota bacterium]|nr:type II toxin-antitoxin system ParD family antitoxin [Chloroflexota bacterium]
MALGLAPGLEAIVRERIESGRYANDGAVIDEALRLLEERDKLEHLRALVDEAGAAVARGEIVGWTPDLLDRMLREAIEGHRNGGPIDADVLP